MKEQESQDGQLKKYAGRINDAWRFWHSSHYARERMMQVISDWRGQWDYRVMAGRQLSQSRHVAGYNLLDNGVHQIKAPILKSPLSIRVAPTDSYGEQVATLHRIQEQMEQGMQPGMEQALDFDIATTYNAILRNIERQSHIMRVHSQAAEDYAIGGYSFLRLDVERSRRNPAHTEIKIRPIADPMSVYVDPQGFYSADWSQAEWAFETIIMNKERARGLYGKDVADNPMQQGSQFSDMGNFGRLFGQSDINDDRVLLIRMYELRMDDCYWVINDDMAFPVFAKNMMGYELNATEEERKEHQRLMINDAEAIAALIAARIGGTITDGKAKRCYWGILHGDREAMTMRPYFGDTLPIIPITPPKLRDMSSLYHMDMELDYFFKPPLWDAVGPQSQLNHMIAGELDAIDASLDVKVMMGKSQIDQHTIKDSNDPDAGTVTYDDTNNPNPPVREFPKNAPLNLVGVGDVFLKRLTMTMGGVSPEAVQGAGAYQSGAALQQSEALQGNFRNTQIIDYQSAVVRAGHALVSMIPLVYTSQHAQRIDSRKVAVPTFGYGKTGSIIIGNHEQIAAADLQAGIHDLQVDLKHSALTDKDELTNLMMELAGKTNMPPEITIGLMNQVLGRLPYEGTEEMSKLLVNMLPAHVLTPEQQAIRASMPKPEPTIEQQIEQMRLESEMARTEAAVKTSQSKTIGNLAQEITKLSETIPASVRGQMVDVIQETLGEMVMNLRKEQTERKQREA